MHGFQDGAHPLALSSARVVVPLLLRVLGQPATALDVGCGTGAWVEVLLEHGVDAYGVDLSEQERYGLRIDPARFHAHDLRLALDLGRRFELVLCLEVGEHLPDAAADTLVGSVVTHAPVVVFSAAVPGQKGANHVNEQWPSYWSKLFTAHGYKAIDALRPAIWNDSRVARWYRQNMIVFASTELHVMTDESHRFPLDIVHPDVWQIAQNDLATAKGRVAIPNAT